MSGRAGGPSLPPEALAAEQAGVLVFDMRSFRADTPEARKLLGLPGATDEGMRKQVDDSMLQPGVPNVDNHPTATFKSRSAAPPPQQPAASKTAYDLVGSFTLHGVTRSGQSSGSGEALPSSRPTSGRSRSPSSAASCVGIHFHRQRAQRPPAALLHRRCLPCDYQARVPGYPAIPLGPLARVK